MVQFSELPTELHLHIASKCSSRVLAALCRTSRLLQTLCTKYLYEKVDLGRHASQIDGKIYHKQSNFLRTLKRRPEYAGYVESLKWSFVVLESEELVDKLPHLPSYSKHKPLGLWEILLLLTEVISVEIDQDNIKGYPRAMIPPGLSLFPKATSISMFGKLTDTFVHAVLPVIKARQLRHLRLSHVQLDGPDAYLMDLTIKFLNSLTTRCTSLKSLNIVDSDYHILEPCSAQGGATMSTAYIKFLESVRETLVTFSFRCRNFNGDDEEPEDALKVTDSIIQVLKRGTWPRLQKVTTFPLISGWLSIRYGDWD